MEQVKGTVNSSKAPWETYSASFEEKVSPQLQKEIDSYSQRRHDKSSTQNEEELCRQREINSDIAKQYQWVTPAEYADAGARIGRIMHSSEFINKLRNDAHIRCWYRQHPQPGKVTLVIQRKEILPPETGCWVQLGFMPELTVMGFDDHGVPLAEKYRGWRTCVLQLILKEVLTERVANKVFGPPKETKAYDRYNSIVKSWRQGEGRV